MGPQSTLSFDEAVARARTTDPSSSHAAADSMNSTGKSATDAQIVLEVLRCAGKPLTFREVHARCSALIPEAANVGRRLDSLRVAGLAQVAPEKRICTVRPASPVQAWEPTRKEAP